MVETLVMDAARLKVITVVMAHLQTTDLAEHGMPPYQRLNKVHPSFLAAIFSDRTKPLLATPPGWKSRGNLRLLRLVEQLMMNHWRKRD